MTREEIERQIATCTSAEELKILTQQFMEVTGAHNHFADPMLRHWRNRGTQWSAKLSSRGTPGWSYEQIRKKNWTEWKPMHCSRTAKEPFFALPIFCITQEN